MDDLKVWTRCIRGHPYFIYFWGDGGGDDDDDDDGDDDGDGLL